MRSFGKRLRALGSASLSNQNIDPTTSEHQKVVDLAHKLESDPLAADADENRRWLMDWVERTADVDIPICPDLLRPLEKTKKMHGQEIYNQMIFSSAAYIISNPTKSQNNLAICRAGLEGSLRAYQAILYGRPDSRWKFMDDLVARQTQGTLDEYIRRTLGKMITLPGD